MSDKDHQIVYLSGQDVAAAGVDMPVAIDVIEKVLGMHARGEVTMPSKVILDLDERKHGRINAMPAHLGSDVKMCGIKWIAGFPNNPVRYNIPRANALIVLNDPETGLPVAIIEGTQLSALRTGAVTGVGARYLARQNSRVAGLIGAGVQSRTQIDALLAVLPGLTQVKVFDVRAETARDFVRNCRHRWPKMETEAAKSPEQAVRGADVVVTATVADEPIVKAAWLKPGVFFAHVGSYQEEEEAVIQQADKIVVDIWEEVLHRKTPLLARMYEAGKIDAARLHANVGEIVNGQKPGRENDQERIFFSPLGLGSEDVGLATEVYRRAIEIGLGRRLPFGAAQP